MPLPAELAAAFVGGWVCAVAAGLVGFAWLRRNQEKVLAWLVRRSLAGSGR